MSDANAQVTAATVTLLPLESFQPAFGRRILAGAFIGGAVVMAPTVSAQEAAGRQGTTLDPVVVTGEREAGAYQAPAEVSNPRMTAPLLDTPKSITVVPEAVIRDRGATSLQDVLRMTPGITLGSGEGGTPTGDRPFVRGYEASTDIFVDGVRDYARGSHETFNLEAVEVIKGPSSAYTGRGGTGGSINLQTKKPRKGQFIDVNGGFGNAGQWRTTLDANMPLADSAAMRLNVMRMAGEVPGRDGVTVDRWGIAPSVAFGLGKPTRLTLAYAHVQNDDMPDLGVPFNNAARPGRITPPDVNRNNFYGRLNADFRENRQKTGTATIEHDFSTSLKLRNITRHTSTLNHYLMSRPTFDNCTAASGPPCSTEAADVLFRRDDRTRWRSSKSLINQTDLYGEFSTGTIRHSYSVGFEFGNEKLYNRDMEGGPGRSHDSLYNPNPNQDYVYNLIYGDRTYAGEIRTRSLYLFDTMNLTDRFSINLGVRRDTFKVDNTTISREDSFWNYQLGAAYKPAENGSVYLSFGTSSNPVGENLGQGGGADGAAGSATINASIRDLKPERSRSWELGTKWDVLDHRLTLTSAIFETRKTDARSTDPLTGDVTLSGNNRVRGLELAATGAITPKWSIWAGYTYLDPKINVYRSGTSVFDGNQIKFIAKHNATLWTTYLVAPGLTVGGGATYTGMRYANDANTLELPGWVRYDAMARYELTRRLNLQLNVNNIADKPLYDASHVGLFANVAPGRSVMLSASYRFD